MTRKDAIDRLDIIVSKHEVEDVYITLTNEKDYEALKVAINSLRIDERYELEYERAEVIEKMSVIDKIRAEILNFKEKCNASDYLGCGILEIIDKYREREEGYDR